MPIARVTSKGQVTIPKEIRERLGLQQGDALDFELEGDRLEVRTVRRRRLAEFRGLFRVEQAVDFGQERATAWAEQTKRLVVGPEH